MTAAQLHPSTSSGISGSRETHLTGSRPDLRVPMREVLLTTGDSVCGRRRLGREAGR